MEGTWSQRLEEGVVGVRNAILYRTRGRLTHPLAVALSHPPPISLCLSIRLFRYHCGLLRGFPSLKDRKAREVGGGRKIVSRQYPGRKLH